MNNHIEQALTNFRLAATRYAKSERYYDGNHDLAFATEKFQNAFGTLFREFALNLCPVVCDALRDKLRVTGFSVDGVGSQLVSKGHLSAGGVALTDVRATDTDTRRIWQRNRMATRAGEIHKEALKNGDAYAIVWPNERGEAVIYPNKAANMSVVYDEDSPGRIVHAAKYWRTANKYIRLNLFYPDRIEKYISKNQSEGTLPDASGFVPLSVPPAVVGALSRPRNVAGGEDSFQLSASKTHLQPPATAGGTDSIIPNPFGVVPVFHFANNADIGLPGRSELDAAIPVQDGLNKSVLDMLVAMEFVAYRQRWAAGIEYEIDADGKPVAPFQAGADQLWIAENPTAKFGDFEAAHLEQFLKVKDSFRVDIASVSGTPLHYLMQNMDGFPSGESLRKSETRFVAKVRDRQESFGQVWAELMAFALMVEGRGTNIRLITEWADPSPMSEREVLENILLKKQIGLPVEQALLEAGYGEADVRKMAARP